MDIIGTDALKAIMTLHASPSGTAFVNKDGKIIQQEEKVVDDTFLVLNAIREQVYNSVVSLEEALRCAHILGVNVPHLHCMPFKRGDIITMKLGWKRYMTLNGFSWNLLYPFVGDVFPVVEKCILLDGKWQVILRDDTKEYPARAFELLEK